MPWPSSSCQRLASLHLPPEMPHYLKRWCGHQPTHETGLGTNAHQSATLQLHTVPPNKGDKPFQQADLIMDRDRSQAGCMDPHILHPQVPCMWHGLLAVRLADTNAACRWPMLLAPHLLKFTSLRVMLIMHQLTDYLNQLTVAAATLLAVRCWVWLGLAWSGNNPTHTRTAQDCTLPLATVNRKEGGLFVGGCALELLAGRVDCGHDSAAILLELALLVCWPNSLLGPCWVQTSGQPCWLGQMYFLCHIMGGLPSAVV